MGMSVSVYIFECTYIQLKCVYVCIFEYICLLVSMCVSVFGYIWICVFMCCYLQVFLDVCVWVCLWLSAPSVCVCVRV